MTDSVVVGVRVRPLNARENAGASNPGHAWLVRENAIVKVRYFMCPIQASAGPYALPTVSQNIR